MFHVRPEVHRPDSTVISRFMEAEVTMYGHMTDFGFPRGLLAATSTTKFAGPAVTIKLPQLDGTAMHCALDHVQPGDVIVIDHSGETERSCFGGTLAAIAKDKGVVGVVTDGYVNDVDELADLDLPVFSRGVTPHTTRLLGIEGEINSPVSVGGVVVMPGDIVFADADGVAVVPHERAEEVVERVLEKQKNAKARRAAERVHQGESLASLTGARKLFESRLAPARK